MRLSCNFVNVYTISYRVQYTCTRVHARISNGHPREEKSACRTKVRGQVGETRRTCPARGELNGPRAPRQADFRERRTRRLPREDPRAEVGEDVCVGVGVRPMEFQRVYTVYSYLTRSANLLVGYIFCLR